MSIYDFTPAELEEIRRADEEIERRSGNKRRITENCGGDRRSAEFKARQRDNYPGNPLREYREKHNLTQNELAVKLFVSRSTISDIECGKTKMNRYIKEWLREQGETG